MRKAYQHINRAESYDIEPEFLAMAGDKPYTADSLRILLTAKGLLEKMNRVTGTFIIRENLWEAAMTLAMSDDQQVAFRASWALEWAYVNSTELFQTRYVERFFDDFMQAENESVLRVYSKILCDLTRRKAFTIPEKRLEDMASKCFDILLAPETAIAVKVWQIELLADMSARLDWIEENLTEIVRAMSEDPQCTPAAAAHARHYFRRLNTRSQKKR